MNKNKFLIILIGLLLVSNLFLLFLLLSKPEADNKTRRPERGNMMRNFLAQEIGFDSSQLQQFDVLRAAHMEKAKLMLDSMSRAKEQLFSFKEPVADSITRDSLLQQIGRYQAGMDARLRMHLEQVRQLCTPTQQLAWDTLIDKVTRRVSNPWRRDRDSSMRR